MINPRVDLARPPPPAAPAPASEQKQDPFAIVAADELLDTVAFICGKLATHARKPELGDAARRAASVAAALRQAVPVLYRLATASDPR